MGNGWIKIVLASQLLLWGTVGVSASQTDPRADIFNAEVKTPAKLIDGYIIDSDYPKDAIDANASGTTVVDLVVGPTGIVALCGILYSSGNDSLDSRSCELIRARFTFQPALDKNRKPVAERRLQRITWRMPEIPLPVAYDFSASYTVGSDGKPRDCVIEGATPPDFDQAKREKACKSIPNFVPPVGASGKPIKRRFSYRQILTSVDIVEPSAK
jgi:hypothetical protein